MDYIPKNSRIHLRVREGELLFSEEVTNVEMAKVFKLSCPSVVAVWRLFLAKRYCDLMILG